MRRHQGNTHRWVSFAIILISLAVAAFCVIYPQLVMRPDRPQDAGALRRALALMPIQPYLESLSVAAALIAMVYYWRSKPTRKRGALAATVGVLLFAGISRISIYEFIFHPAGTPAFEAARDTKL